MNNFDRIRFDRSSNFFDDLQALDQFKQETKFQRSNNPKSNQDSSSSSQSGEDKKQAILSKNKVKSQHQQNLTIQDQLLGGVHLDLNLKIKQDQDWEQSQKSEYSSQFYENEQDDLNRVIYDRSTSVNMRRRGKRLPGGVLNQIRREFSQQQIGNQKMASRFMPRLKEPFVIESQLLNLRGLFNMKILERLNAVVYDAKNIKSDFDRIQNTIVGHIKECTLAAQNIVKSLESKLIPKLNKEDFYETDDANLIQDIINQFYEKHQPSIATMEYNLKLIKQAITQADNLKLENRQIDLNLQYQVDVMDLRTDNTFGYSEVVGKLDEYTLALVMGDQVTDIVQFKQSDIDEKEIELKKLQQIQQKSTVFQFTKIVQSVIDMFTKPIILK
ncbi:hypothetical protein OXYTRIMIC_552 [Oxytricha trifallax]|uniref:Uncharacterized protein n=1 Tax=Oxytricha trifallax TaxID=1172189 RepID=A0A073HZV2_9SPIT|nr:hypothetical protein OXYTRIMIC_552 [Oxytricha trifallax]